MKLNLKVALELAKCKIQPKSETRSKAALLAWETRRKKTLRCKIGICKTLQCPHLYIEIQKGRKRTLCGKTNEHVSNLRMYKMECQRTWVNQE